MTPTQKFLALRAVDVENFKAGKEKLFRQVRERRQENTKRLGREAKPPEPTEWSGYFLLNRVTEGAQKYDFLARKNLEQLGGRILTMVNQAKGDGR